MPDSISDFFDAWAIRDSKRRMEQIQGSVSENVQYDDPRTTETVNGITALSHYVGLFSENAPGWSAKVIKSDMIAGVSRVTVAFSGIGPDGSEQVQFGQYFVEKDGEFITRMVGFVGTGK